MIFVGVGVGICLLVCLKTGVHTIVHSVLELTAQVDLKLMTIFLPQSPEC